ncbi:MAG: DUF1318 domain-containing protein [Candidatus Hydrogenedentes bacterium]|nr:DUF1318 domain-containing protein [Candidatus Hydrogenedentota bacterium]
MRRVSNGVTLLAVVLIVGCIVIPNTFDANITITIRHVEEQAGQILDYVEGKSDTLPGLEGTETESTSFLHRTLQYWSPIQVAYAAELKDTSPRVTQIAKKMKGRFPEVAAIKATGAVGETNRGLLQLQRPGLISDAEETNRVQRIIAAENEDRKALYKEIARLNGDLNLDVGKVERIYALQRLERAKSGEYYQLLAPGADFNKFKTSPRGQRLGAACVPGAWVTIK